MKSTTENYKCFPDSNVWLYSFTDQDAERKRKAEHLIAEISDRICVSSQVINEVCINLKRKASFDETEISRLISSFYINYQVVPLDRKILLEASELRKKYGFSFWDGLIVASALTAGAEVLYSEDMRNGLIVEKRLKIVNPFV